MAKDSNGAMRHCYLIPVYNEKENLENMVRKVFSLEKAFHILIVDDGSPDGTGAIVKKLQMEFPTQLLLEEGHLTNHTVKIKRLNRLSLY